MKICLINNLYKPLNRGGAEKVTETLAEGLAKAGHEVFVITTKPYNKKFPSAIFRYPIFYINSLYYNLNKFPKFFRFGWHLWDMIDYVSYFKIKKILQSQNCGLVITNNLMGLGYLTSLALKKLKIKHIYLIHDVQLIHPAGLLYYGQEKIVNTFAARNYAGLASWLIDSPDIVIFPSRWLMDMHLEKIFFIKSKRIILPNPVEICADKIREKSAGNFKFLYVGQIEKHKGVLLLIEAFKKISRAAELIIAGDGGFLNQAKLAAADDPRIKFLGRVDEGKVDQLLYRADCLVYPSLVYENCPNVIQRAMAAFLPVLAADLGGISELLSKNAGLLVRPADQADLAEKMQWAIDNKNNLANYAIAGREKAALFQVDNYIKELEKLII